MVKIKNCVVVSVALSFLLMACGSKVEPVQVIENDKVVPDTTIVDEIPVSAENNQEKQTTETDVVEQEREQVETDKTFTVSDYGIPGEEIECTLKGNTINLLVRQFSSAPDVDMSEDTVTIIVSDKEIKKLETALQTVSKSEDREQESILEQDLSNMARTKEFALTYYDCDYGTLDEQIAAKAKLAEEWKDYETELHKNAERDALNKLFQDSHYIEGDVDKRRELVLGTLEFLYESKWIESYDAESTDDVIVYKDAYGYDCGVKLTDWNPMMN